jgi:multidrug resistance efflux pump
MEYRKIPTPPSRYWKELRVKALPLAIFLITAAVVARLWSERVARSNLTGVVVGAHAEIRSPQPGTLAGLGVARFQRVNEGDLIARVVTTDMELLEARLGVVRAEMELVRRGMGPTDNLQRNLMNRASLEADLLQQRLELASAKVEEERLQREHERAARLVADRIITEEEYERIRSEYERVRVKVEVGSELLEEMLRRVEEMRERFDGERLQEDPVAAALRHQEQELRLIAAEAMPFELRAPISGIVSEIFRENGETVVDGEPILVIRSEHPDYVVGYMPHPLRLVPGEGMPVVIRSRGGRGDEFEGRIVRVGAQLEDMIEAQHLVTSYTRMALPLQIEVEEEFPLRPGELVNVTIGSGR